MPSNANGCTLCEQKLFYGNCKRLMVDYVNAMGLNRFCPTWLRMWNCCASIDFGSLSKQLTLLTNIDSISYYYTAFTPNNPCKLYAILNGIFTSIGVCAVLKSFTAQCTCWLLCWKCKCRTFYKVNRVNTHTHIFPLSLCRFQRFKLLHTISMGKLSS